MRAILLSGALLVLAGCGADRYAMAPGVPQEARWQTMMHCRTTVSAERGEYLRSGVALGAGAVDGAVGGALAGAASADTNSEGYADEVDRCMAKYGYVAQWGLPQ